MDLRIKRTKNSIINAFIELRAKRPLEKITVKELADLAFINKATFYTHYKDIYDLSEQLENEAINAILNDIPHPEYVITKPKQGTIDLANAIIQQGKLFNILFSGSRQSVLIQRMESNIKAHIFKLFPEYKSDIEKELLLTFTIYGGFYAFNSYRSEDYDRIIEILSDASERVINGKP